jgi:type II secretory pathway component PulC
MRKFQLYIATLVFINSVFFNALNAEPEEESEAVIDYFQLKNPFISFLPKEQIIKTPVEQPKQTVNNSNQNNKMQMMAQPVVVQEQIVLPAIFIQGILYGVKEPMAIINEQTYGIGDVVQGL